MPGTDSFFDTNVLLYLLSGDAAKADRAEAVLARGGTISVRIPPQCGHGFHGKLDTHSISNWTGIPRETGHLR